MGIRTYTSEEDKQAYMQQRKKDRHKPGRVDTRKGDRHKTKGNRHKKLPAQFDSYPFIAWDGEGVTRENNQHDYCLLMNSDGMTVINHGGLSTVECFETLLAESNKKAIHVIYSGNYDVNKMFKDIPRNVLERIHKGGIVTWHADRVRNLVYAIEYQPKRCLTLHRYDPRQELFRVVHDKNGVPHNKPNYTAGIRLWDVFGFFGCSFLKALENNFNSRELEELGYSDIKAGKERRMNFTEEELQSFIIPYTTREVAALVMLMTRFREYLKEGNVRVTRWDGAGAIASVLLTQMKVKEHYGPPLAYPLYHALKHAYSAGRIETIRYGHVTGKVYHYDLNSAYPAMMLNLPSLLDSWWSPVQNNEMLNEIALLYVHWKFPEMPFYPFFLRGHDGSICYPRQGLNWISSYEYRVARATIPHFDSYVEVKAAYNLVTPHGDIKPYAKVAEFYQIRRDWKRQGIGAQIIFKLGPNSFYGKTVQSLGYDERDGKLPAFFNLLYGSMITAQTRAVLFRAAMQNPEAVIAFSTDGLWSTEPLQLDCGDGLGQWEYEELDGLTIVQSGIYWSHKFTSDSSTWNCTLHTEGCHVNEYYRGYGKGELKESDVLRGWLEESPAIYIPVTRFITLGTALTSDERFKLWGTWETSGEGKKLALRATGKREDRAKQGNPVYGLVLTAATDKYAASHSYPVAFPWDKEYKDVPAELRSTWQTELAMIEELQEVNEQ